MGCCAQQKSIDSTVDSSNSVLNDRFFIKELDLGYIDTFKSESLPVSVLKVTKAQILLDIFSIKQVKNEIITKKNPKANESLLIIEIQKAKNITMNTYFTNLIQLYVEIEFFPLNKKLFTNSCNLKLPIWYKLFKFSHEGGSIEKIYFRVISIKTFDSKEIIGEVCVLYEELKKSLIVHDCFQLEGSKSVTPPQIYLKMQLIKNPWDEYKNYLMVAKENMKKLKQALMQYEIMIAKKSQSGNPMSPKEDTQE